MDRKKKIQDNRRTNYRQLIILAAVVLIMVIMTILGSVYIGRWTEHTWKISDESYEQFERHYVFITDSYEDNFWNKVYQEARIYAEERKIYLEWGGSGLATDYSKAELMRIAISSHVDGIIVEGDGSIEIQKMINEAVDKGIPVVTMMTDSYDSKRQSFVGIGNHNLGREYGRQIIRIANKNTQDVLILMDTAIDDSGKNLVYNGIKDTLDNEGNHLNLELRTLAISEDSAFSEEEAIREIFLNKDELPEIIVCLNEKNTISAYQAAIDHNMVGKVAILGYSDADSILSAISRKVITATVAADAEQIGEYCVKALEEYIETEHVNDFFTMDVHAITSNNVEGYLEDTMEQNEK